MQPVVQTTDAGTVLKPPAEKRKRVALARCWVLELGWLDWQPRLV
jgi:hypothetical protein